MADKAARDGVLLLGNGSDPQTLDPHLLIGTPESAIVEALSEGLVVEDPDDSTKVRPGVAERWSHNADQTQWSFRLRKNAKWSDGRPLTSADFLFSFERLLQPELQSQSADLLFVVKNAQAYYEGEISDFGQVGISAPDAQTLEITLAAPTPYLLPMLTNTAFMPVNRNALLANGTIGDPNNRWATAGNYVGNGPFLLSEWRVGDHILVERNPQYWDAANVSLNAIRFVPMASEAEETEAFLAGKLHVTQSVAADRLVALRKDRPDALVQNDLLGAYYYMFNIAGPPFDDVRVRRALALALDRDDLVRKTTFAGQTAIGGVVPPGIPGYATVAVPAVEIAEARRLLAEAGYPDGTGFPRTDILINLPQTHTRVAEAVQRQWKEALGIDVGIRKESWQAYLDSTRRRKFTIARSGWIAGYPDPGAFLDVLQTGNLNNDMGWSDAEFDTLMTRARSTSNRAQRMALMEQAEARMLDQQPLIPLFNYTSVYLRDPRVRGWGKSLGGNRVYKFVSLSER
ncbi:peptide ABC transporter substrate-binding protein [Croceicoccus naphthovorans]|uniref:peptide ABC transporter substrate-binding protein n=1 Tax=Croceicoccus naphthovorans TaxID=1348774 RepID=UPI00069D9CC3|nr:peptide ABC transporter substrate-binding protein [Croceicoccus naphthovorans]MBB3988776.1 oligopeptide transport system substrate-binding protein [Croceicoccus naphthovorans]